MVWLKRILVVVVLAAIGGGLWWALRERPQPVDLATVKRGILAVTIVEDGQTRVRDVYTLSSAIAGHLDRITLDEGEVVRRGETVVASIHPLDPPFIDERRLAELRSAAEAVRSAVELAKVEANRARTALEVASAKHERIDKLAKRRVVALSQLEQAWSEMKLQEAQVKSADATIAVREAELESALARLRQPTAQASPAPGVACCVDVRAPVDGVVLNILARSEQAVVPGTRLVEIGDPNDLEVVVDLLSSDATAIGPGTRVEITEWGGPKSLDGTVRRIDPAAFTKVSALGISEQRVNAVIDLDTVPPRLGHGFSVLVRLDVWRGEVLRLPIGALFRSEGRWNVFREEDGAARQVPVVIGRMSEDNAEVTDGLETGDRVVMHPSDALEDGSLVLDRSTGS